MLNLDLNSLPIILPGVLLLAFIASLLFSLFIRPRIKTKRSYSFFVRGCVAVLFVSVGIYSGISDYHAYATFKQTTGTVIQMQRQVHRTRRGTSFEKDLPVVIFEQPTGEREQFIDTNYSVFNRYAVGQAVTVLIDPVHPEKSFIKNSTYAVFFPIVLSLIGLFVFIFGCVRPWKQATKRDKEIQRLRSQGTPILCTLTQINRRITSEARFAYNLSVTSNETPQRLFDSDPFFKLPIVKEIAPGQPVTTYVDPSNPDLYWVDTDSLGLS